MKGIGELMVPVRRELIQKGDYTAHSLFNHDKVKTKETMVSTMR